MKSGVTSVTNVEASLSVPFLLGEDEDVAPVAAYPVSGCALEHQGSFTLELPRLCL